MKYLLLYLEETYGLTNEKKIDNAIGIVANENNTTSIPIPQREESENIPSPDLPGQLENVQQSGNEIAERGMPT